MIIAITLMALAAVLAVCLAGDGHDLNFGARDVDQASRARYARR